VDTARERGARGDTRGGRVRKKEKYLSGSDNLVVTNEICQIGMMSGIMSLTVTNQYQKTYTTRRSRYTKVVHV